MDADPVTSKELPSEVGPDICTEPDITALLSMTKLDRPWIVPECRVCPITDKSPRRSVLLVTFSMLTVSSPKMAASLSIRTGPENVDAAATLKSDVNDTMPWKFVVPDMFRADLALRSMMSPLSEVVIVPPELLLLMNLFLMLTMSFM